MSVYIVAAKRTAIGSFMGKLGSFKAPQLGGFAIRAALQQAKLQGSQVDEIIMGNVCQAMVGQNPARQASIFSGIPVDKPCTTINKVCASGMKTAMYGSQSIQLKQANIVVCGGFESMTNIPFYIPNYRKGHTFGNQQLIDGLAFDGLTDVYNNIAMGLCAEKTVNDLQIQREVQDDFCINSYERVIEATKTGKFQNEIVNVEIELRNQTEIFNIDEEQQKYKRDKIPQLKPVFSKNGTITAGNASKINDAGCALILASEQAVKNLNLTPLARIVSYADSEVEPIDFCVAPAKAVQFALQRANMKMGQIDFHEINEAFAATTLANMKLLDIGLDRVNVNGGAVALGHPIGFSGARIIQSLMTVMQQNKGKYGCASICNGGGGGSAIILENLQ